MDDIAEQLDQVRGEFAHLLSAYPGASSEEKQEILDHCEFLGGEVQELVGVLKLSIHRITNIALSSIEEEAPREADQLEQIARQGIRVAHGAGEEVSAAVRLIRQLQDKQTTGEP
ncbi:MAG: hypothetical protein KAV82_10520 [Phycisphaerae bacterium]|nr:hypothetical protein [Phycisphaerae bacterium]